ncbi:hypothetical protein BJ085DRAFT_41111 [Dimargaris cristalligena]|uniref:Uncharacterized protein n=1 Tax=Dimargaris cristalligena TaxID=215637 RepID=A0A4P9ZM03_9FUNG|nr:hypothetical protein BJ085DRAFT_41111 [Dimargaris cristalligena]|eukprot:RKP33642.1 hypothetical protein BJ085DRAFT_41111 [Dimargaris cristalligena]
MDTEFFVSKTVPIVQNKEIMMIPFKDGENDSGGTIHKENQQWYRAYLSTVLVYEGRGELAADILEARLRLLGDGFNLSDYEAKTMREVTTITTLTDCIRASILTNDISTLGRLLMLNQSPTNSQRRGPNFIRRFSQLEYHGFLMMSLYWKRYEAAALIQALVIPGTLKKEALRDIVSEVPCRNPLRKRSIGF